MVKIEYHSPMVNTEEIIKFNKFELKMNPYISVTWSKFHHHTTKGPIEVDETLVRTTTYTLNIMKRPKPSDGDEIS